MGNELTGASGAGNGEPGRAADGGTDQGQAHYTGSFDETVEGRAFKASVQASADRQVNAERLRREDAERRAEDLEQRLERLETYQESFIDDVRQSDPDAYDLLNKKAQIAEQNAELKQLRRQVAEAHEREQEAAQAAVAYQEAIASWNDSARSGGIDPRNPEFQAALQQTLATGDRSYAMSAIIRIASGKQSTVSKEPEPEPGYVSPPSGGSARSQSAENQEAINKARQAYKAEIDEAIRRHDESAKPRIRQKYRKIFRELGLQDIPA